MRPVEFHSITGIETTSRAELTEYASSTKPVEFHSIEEVVSTSTSQIQKRILMIEDDCIVAKMMSAVLERQGYKVQVVSDGNEALETFEKPAVADMVLLDIVLPYVDGYRLLEHICSSNKWKEVPKIMISSNSNESSIVRAFEIGVDDYITKPIQIDEFVARVNRFMR